MVSLVCALLLCSLFASSAGAKDYLTDKVTGIRPNWGKLDGGIGYAPLITQMVERVEEWPTVLNNIDLMVPAGWGVYTIITGDGGAVSVTNTPDQSQLFYKVTTP